MTHMIWGALGVFATVAILPCSFLVPSARNGWRHYHGKRKLRRQLNLYKGLREMCERKDEDGAFLAMKFVNFDPHYNQRTMTLLRRYFNMAAFKEFPNSASFGIKYQIEFFEKVLENPDNYYK